MIFKVPNEKNCQPRNLYQAKILFRSSREIKTSSYELKNNRFNTNGLSQKEIMFFKVNKIT